MNDGNANGPELLKLLARDALRNYGIGSEATLTLLNISENATYRVDDQVRNRITVLRLNRPHYHSRQAIESELAWIRALRQEDVVRTAHVVHADDDSRVVTARHPDGETRNAVMFEWVPGVEPPSDRLVDDFVELGAITARLHEHARNWHRPGWFTRFRWDFDTSIGDRGHWGRWQDGMGVGPSEHEQLDRLAGVLRDRLHRFGTGDDRFGLIHADMRLANLLVEGSNVAVIDFDDCGFGWYLYDLGSSLSFIEHDPRVPEMIDAWVRGYRTELPLSSDEEEELPTFVLLRRLLLVAWIGSHSDTDLAQELGPEYTRISCDLAEDYLARFASTRGGA